MARSLTYPRSQAGFTLLEALLALLILALALTLLISRATRNIRVSQSSHQVSVASQLARGKMYDIEEKLLQDGFQDSEDKEHGDFSDEGWPDIKWEAVITPFEIETQAALSELQSGEQVPGGSPSSLDSPGVAGGPMAGLLGGAQDPSSGFDTSFLASNLELLKEVLKGSVRRVDLTVSWEMHGEETSFVVVAYFTDAKNIRKVIGI